MLSSVVTSRSERHEDKKFEKEREPDHKNDILGK